MIQDSTFQEIPVPDSLRADSSDVIGNMGREMGDTMSMLLSGDLNSASDRLVSLWQYLAIQFIPEFLSAVAVLLLMYLGYRLFRKGTARALRGSDRVDAGLEGLLLKTMTVVAWSFIIIMVLAQFGVNVSALLAGLSIAGIALGFAAKDSLENFIAGITILIDRPFRVGDQVVADGTYGTVQEITLRSTRLRTVNNEVMVMPNMLMINQKLVNHAIYGLLRIEIPFGLAYKESPRDARDVVMKLVKGDARIVDDPAPEVVVTLLNNSSVDMQLRFHIRNTALEMPVKAEYTEKVFYALRDAGIEIPFPHMQLFIDGAKGLQNRPLDT